jgi:hypothetical protein
MNHAIAQHHLFLKISFPQSQEQEAAKKAMQI